MERLWVKPCGERGDRPSRKTKATIPRSLRLTEGGKSQKPDVQVKTDW